MAWDPKTTEILQLAQELIAIPSVSTAPNPRPEEIRRAARTLKAYFDWAGLHVEWLEPEGARYPALLVFFPGQERAPVMWLGHFDVVGPDPDDRQFQPRIEGDYLWGRGAADMKTVVATVAVWMKDALQQGPPYPPISVMLIGNEEEGESDPVGTREALAWYRERFGTLPEFYIAGERTEETGTKPYGAVCTQSRGVVRVIFRVQGARGHSGLARGKQDLTQRLMALQQAILDLAQRQLTLDPESGWYSQVRFPFVRVGEPGLFNITPSEGTLGLEIRPIPQDPLETFLGHLEQLAREHGVTMEVESPAGGTQCDEDNPYLQALLDALERTWGHRPPLCRKLPGSSIRYVPPGRAVIWGQSGLGPHAADERHYIPSILPYYQGLQAFAQVLRERFSQEPSSASAG